ncbi:MAG: hypothetical protein HGA61_04165, partial [Candidatus Moranbacteria bacterium]|nr:hypothetical protein [Candidatus Moranbacteria bacterium]
MENKKNSTKFLSAFVLAFFVLVSLPSEMAMATATSQVGARMCTDKTSITIGESVTISWFGENANLGDCSVSSNLPSPPTTFVPGGSCIIKLFGVFGSTFSYSCSNGAIPSLPCLPDPRFIRCNSCSCPGFYLGATSDTRTVYPDSPVTTYSVTCERSDGNGGNYLATACATINVAPNDCASSVCADRTCNNGFGLVSGLLPVNFDTYSCTQSESSTCSLEANCGKIN